MMKTMLMIVAASSSLMLSGGVLAQDKPADAAKASSPEMIEGQVTKVDTGQGKMTVRASDGTMHEFQASPETLGNYKAGDPIKAKLRKPDQ